MGVSLPDGPTNGSPARSLVARLLPHDSTAPHAGGMLPRVSNQNGLLAALDQADRVALEADFRTVQLDLKDSLHEPGDPTPYVYFPNDGVVSLLTVLANGMAVELGHVGREGMVDISVFLGLEASESRIIIQVPGTAQRMPSKQFRKHVEALPSLRRMRRCPACDESWVPMSSSSSRWWPRRPSAIASTPSSSASLDRSS